MLTLLRERKYRVVLAANFVSLFGSGLSHSAMIWYVLQETRSESAVALLMGLITIPSLFFLPFTGLLIDRVDRRHLMLVLDIGRGIVVACAALSALSGRLPVWQLYVMGMFLGIGGFIYWPSLAALLQELTEARDMVAVNALLIGAAQSGWMLAGAAVGLLYGVWGIAGILIIDACSYAGSAFLYFILRRGKNLDYRREHENETVEHYAQELAAGVRYTLVNRPVLVLGAASALFQSAMISQNVLTAPLNDKLLRSGALGYGFCNAGWSFGAMASSAVAGSAFRKAGRANHVLWAALVAAGVSCLALPFSGVLAVAVGLYILMGGGRGLAGVAVNTALMHEVPRHVMGRTQNLFTFAGILMQLVMTFGAGWLMQHVHLALGFVLVGGGYIGAGILAFGLRNHRPAIPEPAPDALEPEPVVADLE